MSEMGRACRVYGVEEILIVGVLKGAFIFVADLARRLSIPRRVDFVALASYGDSLTSGAIRLILDLRASPDGKHVLIIDDIIDTGATLNYLLNMLSPRNPSSLRSCVLIRKANERQAELKVDYVGFEIDDVWVVGYGLDNADKCRTLPDISMLALPDVGAP